MKTLPDAPEQAVVGLLGSLVTHVTRDKSFTNPISTSVEDERFDPVGSQRGVGRHLGCAEQSGVGSQR